MYYRETVALVTEKSTQGIDITQSISDIVSRSKIAYGIAVIEAPHSTAAVLETTHCSEVIADLIDELDRVIPSRVDWLHQETPEDSAGHIKCAMFGNSISAIVEDGKLMSEGKIFYYFMEYDGPRHRKVNVAIVGEKERNNK